MKGCLLPNLRIPILASTAFAFAVETFSFQPMASDAPTQQEAEEHDPAEHAKGQRFSFRLHTRREGEKAAGEERTGGSTSRGERLGYTVQCTEDGVIRGAVGNLW